MNAPLQYDHLISMLTLQSEMNAKVNPNWLKAGYPFLRAVVVEGSEAMEHHGWKWWKQQTMDQPQLQIELVDIWHFYLSHALIQHGGDLDSAADRILTNLNSEYLRQQIYFDGKDFFLDDIDTIRKMELMIGLAVMRRVSVPLFERLMWAADMGWDELRRQYIGKNVLNLFRQDHGYKTGHYIKTWNLGGGEVEDNVVLAELMKEHDDPKALYAALEMHYSYLLSRPKAA